MPAPEELGFLRVAIAAPELRVADVAFNARATADAMRALVFWTDDWHRTSDWYTWIFTL